jgi:hypothetical protein
MNRSKNAGKSRPIRRMRVNEDRRVLGEEWWPYGVKAKVSDF